MKRWVHTQKEIIEIEWDIDIFPQTDLIQGTTILDTKSNEYQSFIKGMVVAFNDAGFELYNDPEYTHQSNRGSQSWYYTFLKIENQVEIRIIVNVRVSDHANSDKPYGTSQELRERFVDRQGDQLADEYQVPTKPYKVPVEILFNDENYTSYVEALFAIHDTIEDIEKRYAKWRSDHNLSN